MNNVRILFVYAGSSRAYNRINLLYILGVDMKDETIYIVVVECTYTFQVLLYIKLYIVYIYVTCIH